MSAGVLIPLYTYPTDASWEAVRQARRAYPSVKILAIINPYNGVGRDQIPDYVQGIPVLQQAGVTVLGYVYTSYGRRDVEQVKEEIALFCSWYHVDGIFFDQNASQPGLEGYYSDLSLYAQSKGMSLTVGNPGTRAPSYVGTADLLVAYEDSGLPEPGRLSDLPGGRENYALIAHDVPALDETWLREVESYVGYLYVTDGVMPNPYRALPSYFGSLVEKLSKA
jgi:hypothetical protein